MKPSDSPTIRLYGALDVAALLGTTTAALAQQRYEKRGPAFLKFGASVRYREVDLLDYLARSLVPTDDSPTPRSVTTLGDLMGAR